MILTLCQCSRHFSSKSYLCSPWTEKSLGAELTLPSGDSVEGMCSMVTAETATGLLRRITTVPVVPRKAQHWPGEVPGLKTMPGSVPKKKRHLKMIAGCFLPAALVRFYFVIFSCRQVTFTAFDHPDHPFGTNSNQVQNQLKTTPISSEPVQSSP